MKTPTALPVLTVLALLSPMAHADQGVVREITYHQITRFEDDITIQDPVLSDEGNRAVFSRLVPHPGPFPVYVIDASGGNLRQIDTWENLRDSRPTYFDISSDGLTVIGGNDLKIRIASAGGSNGSDVIALTAGQMNAVRLSGDGSKIVFKYGSGGGRIVGQEDLGPLEKGIYMINSDGSGLVQLVKTEDFANRFGFGPSVFFGNNSPNNGIDISRDGTRVVFVVQKGSPGDGSVFTLNTVTGTLTHIAGLFDHVQSVGISGDGNTIAYRVEPLDTNKREGWIADFTGANQRRIVKEDDLQTFVVGGNEGTIKTLLTTDGSMVTFGSQYHVFDTSGAGLFQVGTRSNSAGGAFGFGHLSKATMKGDGTRFLQVVEPIVTANQRFEQLAIVDINPATTGTAPRITLPMIDPIFVKRQPDETTATISAAVDPNGAQLLTSTNSGFDSGVFPAFYYRGVWTPDIAFFDMADSGLMDEHGDAIAGDGIYSNRETTAFEDAEVGVYSARVRAENVDSNGFHHATAVEFGPFFVLDTVPTGTGPTIDSIEPEGENPGDVVTVTGSGFDPDPQNNVIVIGDVLPRVIGGDQSEIRFELPPVFRNDDIVRVFSGGVPSDPIPFRALPSPPSALEIRTAIEFCWESKPGVTYQLLRSRDLLTPFEPFLEPIVGDGSVIQVFESTKETDQFFYRLRVVE